MDCLKQSLPAGVSAKKRVWIAAQSSHSCCSSMPGNRFAKRRSQIRGLPTFLSKSRSTSSQSQIQATSRTVLQPFDSRERSDARTHNMYSARFT